MIEKKVENIIERVKRIKSELNLFEAPAPPGDVEVVVGETPQPAPGKESPGEQIGESLGKLRAEHPEEGGKSLHEYLTAVPDGFVEIDPKPFDSPQQPPKPGGKEEMSPAQKYFQELADAAEESEKTEKNANSGGKPKHDPFKSGLGADEVPEGKKACFACGAIIEENAQFCTACGTAFT